MKVGIITIQNALNHGSTLQAMALQDYIISLGHDCQIFDYQNKRLNAIYRPKGEYKEAIKLLFRGHMGVGIKRN